MSDTQPHDPRCDELRAVFPAIEAGVITEVWDARRREGGDGWVERVTEDLLQLSDPAYKPEPRGDHSVDAATQSALDEEFARSLAIGDDHPRVPYQPRSKRAHPQHHADDHSRAGTASDPSSAAEGPGIEEKIEKLAEVGKQKFELFLSRAKEKYHDMSEAAAQAQQQRQQQGNASLAAKGHGDNPPQGLGYELANTLGGLWSGATAAVAGARTSAQPQDRSAEGQPPQQAAPVWNDGAAKLTAGLGNAASGLKGWFDGARTAVAAKTSGGEEYPSLESQPGARQASGTAPYRRWQPTDTYEGETQPRSINVYHPSSSASSASSLPSTSDDETDAKVLDDAKDSTPRATSLLAGGVPHVPSAVAGGSAAPPPQGKIDLSKIGMLPKKKVSLVASPEATSSTATLTGPTSAPVQAPAAKQVEQEEEEEYTKNPFDER